MKVDEILEEDSQTIIDRYNNNESLDNIGLLVGCDRSTVKRAVLLLHHAGRIKHIRGGNPPPFDKSREWERKPPRDEPAFKKQIAAMRRDHWTYLEIAIETKSSLGKILDICEDQEKAPV